jgi:hypothetical protein
VHELRHTAVALWIAADASPKEVAARAGHTSVSFTLDRYGGLFEGHDRELRDRLDAMSPTPTRARSIARSPGGCGGDFIGDRAHAHLEVEAAGDRAQHALQALRIHPGGPGHDQHHREVAVRMVLEVAVGVGEHAGDRGHNPWGGRA